MKSPTLRVTRLLGLAAVSFSSSFANTPAPASPAPAPARKPVVWVNPLPEKIPNVSHHILKSEAMQRDVGYCVFVPPGYAESKQSYPVLYFLHGATGDETSGAKDFSALLERLIAAGKIPPVICVYPNGGLSRYRDNAETGINVESMIVRELVPLIDREYRTVAQRESRVLIGYSMGGGGSLRLSLVYPDVFSAAGSWAGGLSRPGATEIPPEVRADALRNRKPHVRLLMVVGYKDEASYAAHAPFVAELMAAEYPFTFRTLADVPHKLGLYYQLTGEYVMRFLLEDIATERVVR